MLRKLHFFLFSLLFSLSFCLTNGFADDGATADVVIPEGSFEFRTPDGAAYIQDTPEYQKIPESIIGTNDFEKMRDLPPESQDYILGTKVGLIYTPSRFDPRRGFICTGFLVGPDLFLTNHHCMYDAFGPFPLQNFVIFMDYYQDRDVDRTLGGVTARVSEILRADALKDYALLRLDKPIGDTYGWLELDATTSVDASQSVKIISHPQGRSKEIVRRNTEIVELPTAFTDEVPFLLAYLADSEGGSSGAPVFLREGTGVIAIHHSAWSSRTTGEPLFNAGSLMSYIVPEIRQWLPSSAIVFTPSTIADQTFMVDTSVNLTLPTATGGTPPYTYALSPIPAGLDFNAATQSLSGTPTTPGTTNATYTATDTTDASAALTFNITVTARDPLDVNDDGQVNVIDLAIVALFYGTRVPAGISLPEDVNADGTVNLLDLTAVAQGIDAANNGIQGISLQDIEAVLAGAVERAAEIEAVAAAPNALSGRDLVYRNVAHALADARKPGKAVPETLIKVLQHLRIEMEMAEIPESTALLPNYPNPFNPETWIPYHLATDADVTVTIYDIRGVAVRELTLGHQTAGVYQSKHRAAYWDGKNQIGEPVASGVYFYTLTAGEFTATRKMLIAK